jgi:hypothetical protein
MGFILERGCSESVAGNCLFFTRVISGEGAPRISQPSHELFKIIFNKREIKNK